MNGLPLWCIYKIGALLIALLSLHGIVSSYLGRETWETRKTWKSIKTRYYDLAFGSYVIHSPLIG